MNSITRKIPQNICEEDIDLFKHEYNAIVKKPVSSIYYLSICTYEGFFLSFFPLKFAARKRLSFRDKLYILKSFRRKKFDCDLRNVCYIVAFDQWSAGYFHWLLDTLPRIFIAARRSKKLVLILPKELRDELHLDSLRPFNFSDIKFIERNHVCLLRKVNYPDYLATSGNYNPEILQQIRIVYQKHFGNNTSPQKRLVYISRSKATRRKISNEVELIPILKSKGFIIVYAEDLTFAEQCALGLSAMVLVSNHGAGLSNMLFMNSGASVMEIRHAADSHNNCYFSLASAMDLNYYYLLAEPSNNAENPHFADLIVDPEEFAKELDLMLSNELS